MRFEESPIVRLVADTFEDELRLRAWLSQAAPRAIAELERFALPAATGMAA